MTTKRASLALFALVALFVVFGAVGAVAAEAGRRSSGLEAAVVGGDRVRRGKATAFASAPALAELATQHRAKVEVKAKAKAIGNLLANYPKLRVTWGAGHAILTQADVHQALKDAAAAYRAAAGAVPANAQHTPTNANQCHAFNAGTSLQNGVQFTYKQPTTLAQYTALSAVGTPLYPGNGHGQADVFYRGRDFYFRERHGDAADWLYVQVAGKHGGKLGAGWGHAYNALQANDHADCKTAANLHRVITGNAARNAANNADQECGGLENLALAVFVAEARRNHLTTLHHLMLIDEINAGRVTYADAFTGVKPSATGLSNMAHGASPVRGVFGKTVANRVNADAANGGRANTDVWKTEVYMGAEWAVRHIAAHQAGSTAASEPAATANSNQATGRAKLQAAYLNRLNNP